MALHPNAQRKSQVEIDKVVGAGNLPGFADRERLPYLECILKEVLRWSPPAPLSKHVSYFLFDFFTLIPSSAVGHSSLNNDLYNGFYIPGKSVVMANTW